MPRQLKPCGTNGAYERHRLHGETPCEPCREAHRAYMREYDRQHRRTGHDAKPEPRVLAECGTYAASRRHAKAGEPLCGPCADAVRAYKAEYARQRAARLRERRAALADLIGEVFA